MNLAAIDAARNTIQAILLERIPKMTDDDWRQIIVLAYKLTAEQKVDEANL
jgi:hypothetical protein